MRSQGKWNEKFIWNKRFVFTVRVEGVLFVTCVQVFSGRKKKLVLFFFLFFLDGLRLSCRKSA